MAEASRRPLLAYEYLKIVNVCQDRVMYSFELDLHTLHPDSMAALCGELASNKLRVLSITRSASQDVSTFPEDAHHIAAALRGNTSLRYLDFCIDEFDYEEPLRAADGDAIAASFAAALEQNRSLTHLRLLGFKIGPEGAYAICDALRTTLTLKCLWIEFIEMNEAKKENSKKKFSCGSADEGK